MNATITRFTNHPFHTTVVPENPLAHVLWNCERVRVVMAESDIDDDIAEQVYNYLTKSEYPSGVSEYRNRGIRKKAKRFAVKDG